MNAIYLKTNQLANEVSNLLSNDLKLSIQVIVLLFYIFGYKKIG
jgi:hypothetical protein